MFFMTFLCGLLGPRYENTDHRGRAVAWRTEADLQGAALSGRRLGDLREPCREGSSEHGERQGTKAAVSFGLLTGGARPPNPRIIASRRRKTAPFLRFP